MYNILICDDEADIRSALKIYLKGEGYELFDAENGKQALEVIEKNEIHLLIMDIMMYMPIITIIKLFCGHVSLMAVIKRKK